MAQVWPLSTIRELISLATARGEARAKLRSQREAELFRQAIYSYRKANEVGYDLRITIEDLTVVLKKKPTVVILEPQQEHSQ